MRVQLEYCLNKKAFFSRKFEKVCKYYLILYSRNIDKEKWESLGLTFIPKPSAEVHNEKGAVFENVEMRFRTNHRPHRSNQPIKVC